MVVMYEKEMSVIKIPWVERDIQSLHDRTIARLVGGLPDRLRGAIEQVSFAIRKGLLYHRRRSLWGCYFVVLLFAFCACLEQAAPRQGRW